MKAKAVDISGWQKNLDYAALRAKGIEYAFIKATEGTVTSSTWGSHVNGCVGAGMNIGAYSYIVASSVDEARAHAKKFVQELDRFRGLINCPVYADMEDNRYITGSWTKDSRTKVLVAFLEEVKKAGYYAAVYINPSWLESFVHKEQIIGKYDIWLAAWTENPDVPTRFNYGQTVWQWGLDKTLGVEGGVDGDLVFVDYPAIVRQRGLNYLTSKPVATSTPVQQPTSSDKIEEVRYIMQSVGKAAIRSGISRDEENPQRCKKGYFYAFDRKITKSNGEVWLRHSCIGLYSMYKDGGYLFRKEGTYTRYKTTSGLNIRENPSKNSARIGGFCAGAYIFVFDEEPVPADGFKWVKVLDDGKIGYVASEYLQKL